MALINESSELILSEACRISIGRPRFLCETHEPDVWIVNPVSLPDYSISGRGERWQWNADISGISYAEAGYNSAQQAINNAREHQRRLSGATATVTTKSDLRDSEPHAMVTAFNKVTAKRVFNDEILSRITPDSLSMATSLILKGKRFKLVDADAPAEIEIKLKHGKGVILRAADLAELIDSLGMETGKPLDELRRRSNEWEKLSIDEGLRTILENIRLALGVQFYEGMDKAVAKLKSEGKQLDEIRLVLAERMAKFNKPGAEPLTLQQAIIGLLHDTQETIRIEIIGTHPDGSQWSYHLEPTRR